MATEAPVRVKESNDEVLKFTLTSTVVGYTLTGKTFEFFVKKYKSDEDAEALVTKTGPGANIIVDDPDLLKLSVKIDHTEMPVGNTYFYRLDVIESGEHKTAMYGPFIVEDL